MPIQHFGKDSACVTGDSINYVQLCAQKGAVSLEMKGIRMSRGPVLWKRLKAHYGIKGNQQAVYDWLCAKVEELKPQQEHRIVENGREIREVDGKEVN